MTYVLTADEGKWITETGFYPEQEECPNFWKEVRTSDPQNFEEITDDDRVQRLAAWHDAHPKPSPEPEPEPKPSPEPSDAEPSES